MAVHRNHQAGFSIISLMIASAIGIFLIGGAAKVYVDSKNSFTVRSSFAAATENYRFAFQDMRRVLVMAGRSILPSNDDMTSYSTSDNGLRTFPGLGADGILDADANGSSRVAVRYASGPAPCGMAGTLGGDVVDTITAMFYVDADKNLVCEVPEENYSQPLVSGIERMRALYGVDTDGDGVANQYLTASLVDSSALWVNVVAIRIGIVTSPGDDRELPYNYRPSSPTPMDVLGDTFTPTDTEIPYKAANVTIQFRNLHQAINRQNANLGA
ncbi:MAG: PilW family protein [Candidatus Thiodiazotropha sp.]